MSSTKKKLHLKGGPLDGQFVEVDKPSKTVGFPMPTPAERLADRGKPAGERGQYGKATYTDTGEKDADGIAIARYEAPKMEMVDLIKTCAASPSQWDGKAKGGTVSYICFRSNHLAVSISHGTSGDPMEAVLGVKIVDLDLDEPDPGYMSTSRMMELTAQKLNWDAVKTVGQPVPPEPKVPILDTETADKMVADAERGLAKIGLEQQPVNPKDLAWVFNSHLWSHIKDAVDGWIELRGYAFTPEEDAMSVEMVSYIEEWLWAKAAPKPSTTGVTLEEVAAAMTTLLNSKINFGAKSDFDGKENYIRFEEEPRLVSDENPDFPKGDAWIDPNTVMDHDFEITDFVFQQTCDVCGHLLHNVTNHGETHLACINTKCSAHYGGQENGIAIYPYVESPPKAHRLYTADQEPLEVPTEDDVHVVTHDRSNNLFYLRMRGHCVYLGRDTTGADHWMVADKDLARAKNQGAALLADLQKGTDLKTSISFEAASDNLDEIEKGRP